MIIVIALSIIGPYCITAYWKTLVAAAGETMTSSAGAGSTAGVAPKQSFNEHNYWKTPIATFDIDALASASAGGGTSGGASDGASVGTGRITSSAGAGSTAGVAPKQSFNEHHYWKTPIATFDIDALLLLDAV